MDSNSGGEIRRPEIAVRTGPNASRGLMPRSSTSACFSAAWMFSGGPVRDRLERGQRGVQHLGEVLRQALAGVVGDVDRVVGLEQEGQHLRRLAEQGDALLDQRRGLGQDLLLAVREDLPHQARVRAGTGPAGRGSPPGRACRMWVPLMASAFLRSNRAGLARTSWMSKCCTSSSTVKMSSSAVRRPAQQREVVQQPLGDEAAVAVQEQVRLAGRAWRASCCPRP